MNAPKNIIYGYIDPRNGHLRYVGQSSSGMKRPKAFKEHRHGRVQNLIKNLIKDNCQQAANAIGCTRQAVWQVLKGRTKQVFGHTFKYLTNPES
jgi:hypothetical protein